MAGNSIYEGRVLVTGGAGFIGSALVWALNRRGVDNIWIADNLDQGPKWRNLLPLRFQEFVPAHRMRELVRDRRLKFFSLVLHMGACSSTTETDSGFLWDNNFECTRELAEWAVESNIRMVYASSAATYGDSNQGMTDSVEVLERLRPLNPYGFSKHMFDLQAWRRGWLDRLVGLKFFNVFGPNEAHKGEMRSLVDKAFREIRQYGRMSLFKSYRPEIPHGEQQRDFLYVKDAVEMTLFLAENQQAQGLYNLGSGQASTWLELARALFRALDSPQAVEFIEMPLDLRDRYQYYTCADLSRLLGVGYAQPLTSLEKAVEDYVRAYLIPDRRLGDEGLE